jgi:hypothetical protein
MGYYPWPVLLQITQPTIYIPKTQPSSLILHQPPITIFFTQAVYYLPPHPCNKPCALQWLSHQYAKPVIVVSVHTHSTILNPQLFYPS